MAATGSLLLRVGFFLVTASRGYSLLWCVSFSLQCSSCYGAGSRCTGCSSRGTWAQSWHMGSVVAHGLSCCSARAWLLCGMWGFPRPRIKPVSPVLQGGLWTTDHQRSPFQSFLFVCLPWMIFFGSSEMIMWFWPFFYWYSVLHWFFGC